jgi:hypothetical protein
MGKIFFYVNPNGNNDFRFEPCNKTKRIPGALYFKLHQGELELEFINFFIDQLHNGMADYTEIGLDLEMAKFLVHNAYGEFKSKT